MLCCYRAVLFLKDYKIAIRSIRGAGESAAGARSLEKVLHIITITLHLFITEHDFILGH